MDILPSLSSTMLPLLSVTVIFERGAGWLCAGGLDALFAGGALGCLLEAGAGPIALGAIGAFAKELSASAASDMLFIILLFRRCSLATITQFPLKYAGW